MTKRSRTILFLACIIVFVIAAPILTLYSQGFRFDFQNKKLVQTGGISIQTSPKQVEIFINEKSRGKTDFFFGSALIENLLPQKHKIKLEKEGYFSWEKLLAVEEGLVTEARNVYLFPKNPGFTALVSTDTEIYFKKNPSSTTATTSDYIFSEYRFRSEKNILYLFNPEIKSFEKFFEPFKNLVLSPDEKKLAFFSDSELWVFFLQDIFDQPQRKKGEKIILARFSEKIGNVSWINQNYLVFTTGDKIKISEIDNRDRINVYDLGEFKNPQMIFNIADSKLYLKSEGVIYSSVKLLP